MPEKKVKSESTVTQTIIDKIHLALMNQETGEELLNYLKDTEPIFMNEIQRYTKNEITRCNYNFTDQQKLYLATIIGATYISGFLISREATHILFNDIMGIDSIIGNVVSMQEIDEIIDRYSKAGKSSKEIGKLLEKYTNKRKVMSMNKEEKKHIKGKRLKLNGLN